MRTAATVLGLSLIFSLLAASAPQMARAQDDPVAPPPAKFDAVQGGIPPNLFEAPDGLTRDIKQLLWELGYLDSPTSVVSNPLTYRFCMEVAVKCHVQRRYVDSLAFVRRASQISETSSALYLTALNQLALGSGDEAATTIIRLKSPTTVKSDYGWLREKMSSPLTVRINLLMEVL